MKDKIQENSPELRNLDLDRKNYLVSNSMHPIQKKKTVHCKTSQHWDKEDISKLLNRKKKKKRSHIHRLGIRRAGLCTSKLQPWM